MIIPVTKSDRPLLLPLSHSEIHCSPPCPNVWVSPGQWSSNLNCTFRIPWRGCWSPDRWPQPEFLIQEEWGGAQNSSFQTDSQVGPELHAGTALWEPPPRLSALSLAPVWSCDLPPPPPPPLQALTPPAAGRVGSWLLITEFLPGTALHQRRPHCPGFMPLSTGSPQPVTGPHVGHRSWPPFRTLWRVIPFQSSHGVPSEPSFPFCPIPFPILP